MILNQHPTHKNYYLSKESKLFVYSLDTTNSEFAFNKAFIEYNFNFVLAFYQSAEFIITDNLTKNLDSKVQSGRKIIWIDSLVETDINSVPGIDVNSINKASQYSVKFGKNDNERIYLDNSNPVGQPYEATIKFVEEDYSLIFEVDDRETHRIIANNKQENEYDSFLIPLIHQKKLFNKESRASKNNVGSICFKIIKKDKNSIQPDSSFLIQEENNQSLISYKYFDDTSFSQNFTQIALLYPVIDYDNVKEEFHSYIELFADDDVKTTLINEKGQNFIVPKEESIVSRLAYINPIPSNKIARAFSFIPRPEESLNLNLENEGSQLLIGNSGTESIKKTKLKFIEYTNVRISNEGTEQKITIDNDNSLTSVLSIASGEEDGENYFLDSEKNPLFKNIPNSSYAAISQGTIQQEVAIPIIPTLSFKDNPALVELEKVFSKIRLDKAVEKRKSEAFYKSLEDFDHITPQGFKKTGNRYDFINNNNKNSFQFSISDFDPDFDLSLTKEQSFFVLTPSLFKTYKDDVPLVKLDVKFAVNKTEISSERFVLSLNTSYNGSGGINFINESTIIIFKFHNKTVKELLGDTKSWTNYGEKLRTQLSDVKDNINNYLSKEKIKDDYFNKIMDENWNGILILDIPISDSKDLPDIVTGIASSQKISDEDSGDKVKIETKLKFQYVAFPANKTEIVNGKVDIRSTSFYGLIDYNPLRNTNDYKKISKHFTDNPSESDPWRFILAKLKVKFTDSKIMEGGLEAYAFLQIPKLFDNKVKFKELPLSFGDDCDHCDATKKNLVLLKGSYQKPDGQKKLTFSATLNSHVEFQNNVIKKIIVSKIGFTYNDPEYRFDISATVEAGEDFWKFPDLFSFKKLDFENIGLKFKIGPINIPDIEFDLSKLALFPDIKPDGNGFLSSFPIKFSHFKVFELTRKSKDEVSINYDYFTLPEVGVPDIQYNTKAKLFSLIFDFDLGTLGNLDALKALKGQLLIGWTRKGGFAIGFKLADSGSKGLSINLFGALKIDIEQINICSFENGEIDDGKKQRTFFLRLIGISLAVLGKTFPDPEEYKFDGIIFANAKKGSKIAWFLNVTKKDGKLPDFLALGIGQRVGIENNDLKNVEDAIVKVKKVFDEELDPCENGQGRPVEKFYMPDRNWLIASESVFGALGSSWEDTIDFQFIFNDPSLYGIRVGLKKTGLEIDVLYQKLSDNQGLWSTEIILPDNIRTRPLGSGYYTLPNIGFSLSTQGDWNLNIGFPATSNDWSRSGFLQLDTIPPLVGWAGFYLAKIRSAEMSLFGKYASQLGDTNIIQAGFAFRVGLGKYLQMGILFVGASISVYGTLEGAFAFDKGDRGAGKFFPDHFALRGRVGAIAEVVGYVDFRIVKAAVHIILRVEVGIFLALIDGNLKPVPLYIEGEVRVRIRVTITCFKIFRKRICIRITFSFRTQLRFQYTIGGSGKGNEKRLEQNNLAKLALPSSIKVNFGAVPIIFAPTLTKSKDSNKLLFNFCINLFGYEANDYKATFSQNNILKNNIIRPLFEAFIEADNKTYKKLREDFTEDENGNEVEIDLSSFIPTYFINYDLESDKDHIQEVYGLSGEEYEVFAGVHRDELCDEKPEKCSFRPIPMPMPSRIKIVDKYKGEYVWNDGFKIKFSGSLFGEVSNTFEKIDYGQDYIQHLDDYFDKYRTQFLEGKSYKNNFNEEDKDLIDDFILQEYFKLIGLITLEKGYNEYFDKYREKYADAEDEYDKATNPFVSIKTITDSDGKEVDYKLLYRYPETGEALVEYELDVNDFLDEVIGQVNYFYNNGLRLPKDNWSNETLAYSEIIAADNDQDFIFNPDATDVSVVFEELNNRNEPIDVTKELFANSNDVIDITGFKEFAHKITDEELFSRIIKEFSLEVNTQIFCKPYELADLTLPIGNSKLVTTEGTTKFFEIPLRLQKLFEDGTLSSKVKRVKPKDDLANIDCEKLTQVENVKVCTNIEMQVRPYTDKKASGEETNDKNVLEISGVYVEDLNLMTQLKEAIASIEELSISLYVKDDKDEGKTTLINLEEDCTEDPANCERVTIVKTNLSPRTYPPIIIDELFKAKSESLEDVYIAKSNETTNFIRLVWEGLTTNNGGYYFIIPDGSVIPSKSAESKNNSANFSLILSVEIPEQSYPHFCNCLKIKDSNDLFSALDNNEQALILCDLQKDSKSLKEYHTKVPAHCISFEIKRELESLNGASQLFTPLEYQIKKDGQTTLSKDQVLPIMPSSETEREVAVNKLTYKHVSPLDKDISSGNRYSSVGKKYTFTFGLRDIYGFRAIENLFVGESPITYTHKYFDKIIPISAWPIIKYTTELVEIEDNKAKWKLYISIDNEEYEKIKDQEGVKEQLRTIRAQLSDDHYQMSIELPPTGSQSQNSKLVIFDEEEIDGIKVLINKILASDISGYEPVSVDYAIELEDFKTAINPTIVCSRKVDDEYFVNPQDTDGLVIDGMAFKTTSSPILLEGKVKVKESGKIKEISQIQHIEEYLQDINSNFQLGIGSDRKSGKLVYLINNQVLKGVFPETSFDKKTHFYGITPFSNKLWSGEYTSQDGNTKRISDFDLDSGLKAILNKIDDLLDARNINELLELIGDGQSESNYLTKLISAKKSLAKSRNELSQKVEYIGRKESKNIKEFDDLLSERLINFYNYDGIVSLELPAQSKLKEHRLLVSLESNKDNYNLVSSKLYYKNKESEPIKPTWTILFDNKENNIEVLKSNFHNFTFQPKFTHIEYDIADSDGTEIVESSWIQLLSPFVIENKYEIKEFPSIVREYPPQPELVFDKCKGSESNEQSSIESKWSSEVGKWNFCFGVKDNGYTDGDKLYVNIHTKSSGIYKEVTRTSFEGFIAYWGSKLTETNEGTSFDKKVFIDDLESILQRDKSASFKVDKEQEQDHWFKFSKNNSGWELEKADSQVLTVVMNGANNQFNIENLRFEGANIFEKSKSIVSVLPEVYVTRNEEGIDNSNFHYRTASVQPAAWMRPSIRLYTPLYIGKDELFDIAVFKEVLSKPSLPYKTTAKYLIDNLTDTNKNELPTIPVQQIELNEGIPNEADKLFENFENGYQAFKITVYGTEDSNADLPIFIAETVYKKKE
ncbi:hypothetical protein PZB74_10655 [Porifericola rhodea]|uniref:hypothetical protein n=1 Tax=Porifericola rhodea TaxID=930972 RepID=UPI002665B970|nr:hypothetical protein [Porifericola rhodea]WKN33784.1 hypothetical protein PZB74_10655 [Porifericola rhodea]